MFLMIPSAFSSWIKHLPRDCLNNHCTSISKCKQAHAFLLRRSLFDDPLRVSKLVSFLSLSPSGELACARAIFSQLAQPDVFILNTIIRAHANGPNPADTAFFFNLLRFRVTPDHFTYPFAITACARLRALDHGVGLHANVLSVGLVEDVFVVNSLIQVYADCVRKTKNLKDIFELNLGEIR